MKLGELYKKLRFTVKTELGESISIKDFADEIGLSAPRISELENNKREMSLTELKAYHKYFNVSFEYLLGETDISSIDEDVQTACKVTGLSEDAILNILSGSMDGRKKTYLEILDRIILSFDGSIYSYLDAISRTSSESLLLKDYVYKKTIEQYGETELNDNSKLREQVQAMAFEHVKNRIINIDINYQIYLLKEEISKIIESFYLADLFPETTQIAAYSIESKTDTINEIIAELCIQYKDAVNKISNSLFDDVNNNTI